MIKKSIRFRLLFIVFFLVVVDSSAQITLSEIMYDPLGNENYEEFIELYNLSETESVDLSGWQISDGKGNDFIRPVDNGLLHLKPLQFALILDPGYFANSTVYDSLFPQNVLLLTIDNATFGSGGLSNSQAETISLLDSTGTVASEFTYATGNQHGYSTEKINLAGANIAANWSESLLLHGTPGFGNSVTRWQTDLGLSAGDIIFLPLKPSASDSIQITATVHNWGTVTAQGFSAGFYLDRNHNSVAENDEMLAHLQEIETAFSPGDSLTVSLTGLHFSPGTYSIIVVVFFEADQKLSNNQAIKNLSVGQIPRAIIINEVMYHPAADEPEWIELFNRSPAQINLRDWTFSDSRETAKVKISPDDYWISPQAYVVIAQDISVLERFPGIDSTLLIPNKGFPVFNNDGDAVVLRDFAQTTIDSLHYNNSWGGGARISLERISPDSLTNDIENWGGCQNSAGATPGKRNSLQAADYDLVIQVGDILFEPISCRAPAEIEITARILNQGLYTLDSYKISIFFDQNQNHQLEGNEIIQQPFEGFDLPPNSTQTFTATVALTSPDIYHFGVWIEADNDENLSNNLLITEYCTGFPEKSIVINEIMFKPASDQAEWVELFNPTSQVITCREWSLYDSHPENRLIFTEPYFEISPGGFAILADDSSFTSQYPLVDCPIHISANLPALNDDTDQIVLHDWANFVVDSIVYESSGEGDYGVSFERRFWDWDPFQTDAWQPSLAVSGATPGAINSIEPNDIDLMIQPENVTIFPEKINYTDSIQIIFTLKNAGKQTVDFYQIQIFNISPNDSLFENPTQLLKTTPVIASESVIEISTILPPSLPGNRSLVIFIDCPGDLNQSDNLARIDLPVGFPPGVIVINEIMSNPLSGSNEWIELYNIQEYSVDIGKWSIADGDGTKPISISPSLVELKAGEWAIVTKDSLFAEEWPDISSPVILTVSAFPALNNDEEKIWLYDLIGNKMDSVFYDISWESQTGVSQERINPAIPSMEKTNWSLSVTNRGGTPGAQNSIYVKDLPSKTTLSVTPNPFSPDNDGFDDFAIIKYRLPVQTATVNLKIYDVRGRLIRILLNSEPSGAERTILWDGDDDNNLKARMGIYIIYLEALNETKGLITHQKKTVVLAGQL